MREAGLLMQKNNQGLLFPSEELAINVNGVRAVNSVDVYDLILPFDSTPGQFVEMNKYVKKEEYIYIHPALIIGFVKQKLQN